ncbi:MAG: hypothetical protein HZA93_15850 [Verrucomicrobia bacterium]|nr:hypothetical protein [Verrucomicrobiota bacterium]
MKLLRYLIFFAASASLALAEGASSSASSDAGRTTWLALWTIAFIDLVFLLCLILVSATLRRDSSWSLAHALAENISWPDASGSGATLGAAGVQVKGAGVAAGGEGQAAEPRCEPSSSRLIAFIGMLAVMVVFVGLANYVVWVAFQGRLNEGGTTELLKFLAGGSSLFVPYAVNQFRSAFEAFGGPAKKNP